MTSLVGRARELVDLESLLAPRRLITLTGPGGAGKTRLALEVARRYSGVVAWVELSPVGDPSLIAHQALFALGGRSGGQNLAIETVLDLLRAGRHLLVLDNCEHLIEGCALFARAVLHGTETTTILATSREALGVAGEQVWPVPPLTLPDDDPRRSSVALESSEAVALFVERARAATARFTLDHRNAPAVAEICRRLDGLPLAIELAAARVRALTPEEIARRLAESCKLLSSADRSIDSRHRTLEAAIDWSFDLLGEEERTLLLRLSVFAGGFSIDAAERVCAGDGIAVERVLDLVMALVDRSLVMVEPQGEVSRYWLLQTVRQYGEERLDPVHAERLRALHAETFVDLAEAAEPHLFGGAASPTWMARLESELANLRAALDWALRDPTRVDVALRIAAALHWFWFARGRLREGRRALARALGMDAPGSPVARAHAAIALGQVAVWQTDVEAIGPAMTEGVRLLESVDEGDFWRAYGQCGLAIARTIGGDLAATLPLIDQGVLAARRHRHTALLPFALYWRGRVLCAMGDTARGLQDAEEAVAASRAQGHRPGVAHCLNVEGQLRLAAGDLPAAAHCLGESLTLHLETGDHWGIARLLENFAELARRVGRIERAVAFHAAAASLREAVGTPLWPLEGAMVERAIAECRDRLSTANFEQAWRQGADIDLEQVAALARDWDAGGEWTAAVDAPAEPAEAPARRARIAAVLEVRALGSTEVRLDGAAVDGLWGRPQELLVLLAWHDGGVRRDEVGLALWPDASPEKLRNLFHVTLHRLRKCMGAREWVLREGDRYRLTPSIPWELDARRFESEVTAALRDSRRGSGDAAALGEASPAPPDTPQRALRLARALELYRGPFLQGESAGEWQFEIRERLEELWLEGTRALARAAAEAGREGEAAAALRRLIEHDPVDEEASRALIASALRRGERTEALREYKRLERALDDELGVEPGPEVAALYQELRRGRRAGRA